MIEGRRVNKAAITRLDIQVLLVFAQRRRKSVVRQRRASLRHEPNVFKITIAAEINSGLTFAATFIQASMRASSPVEQRRLRSIETIIQGVDMFGEHALQSRSRRFAQ